MNILYIVSHYPNPEEGGVERVTSDLASWFKQRGHKVFCLSICEGIPVKETIFEKCFIMPEKGSWATPMNIKAMQSFQENNKIHVIIVQSEKTQALELMEKGILNQCKCITVLHTSPINQRGGFDDFIGPLLLKNGFWKTVFTLPFSLFRSIYNSYGGKSWERVRMCRAYQVSNAYVALSRSFHSDLIRIGHFPDNGAKLRSIPNPLKIADESINYKDKDKIVLWVGRLCFSPKRPDRVLRIWRRISNDFPDWSLYIVGDGEARPILEHYCVKNNIPNVVFTGRDNPVRWYKRSSVFCMTSSWEGWGLVLTEAMNYGCVPIAYDSYSSLKDIIDDSENGFAIPAFKEDLYLDRLRWLMEHDNEREILAQNAIQSVKQFSIDNVGRQWEKLFSDLIQ